MKYPSAGGLHRRNFISTQVDNIPLDTIGLVSPSRFAIFQGNFAADDDEEFSRKPLDLKAKIIIAVLAVLVIAAGLSGYFIGKSNYRKRFEPPDPEVPLPPSPSTLHVFQKGAVCTDAAYCSKVGRQILYQNGSAVDAAIAAMFCNGLLNHQSMGLGGGFFMTVYIKQEEKGYVINAREKAPAAASVTMFEGNYDKSRKGPLAVGVPGEVKGLWTAHQRWGKLPWASLIEPTIKVCKTGYTVSKAMYDGMLSVPFIKNDPHLGKMYFNSEKGEFRRPGITIKPPENLCETFRRIAENGGDDFYNGTLAEDLVADLERAGSIITAEDLRDYTAVVQEPLIVDIGDGERLMTPLPPSSGIILVNILNILKGYKFNFTSISSTENQILTYHRILEAFKYAYATRTKLGDSEYLDLKEIIANVTSPEFGESVRLKINDSTTSNSSAYYGATEYSPPDNGTAHISIIAPNGDAVSVTSSINMYFGAGFTTAKTGIVMNNVMDDFSSPGIVNYFGIKPSPANFIAPGKRPLSSMSPSLILDRNNNVKMAVGAAGGTMITTAVALVTIRKLWLGMTIKEAVDAPRLHHQIYPMHVQYEYGMTEGIVKGLRSKGHGMVRYTGRGSVICAMYRNSTGIYANADFRKGGDVAGME